MPGDLPASKGKGKGKVKSSDKSNHYGKQDVWSPLWIKFLKTIVTQNYINICADPECTQKVKIEMVRPMWKKAVQD